MTKYCRLVIWEADIETKLQVQMVTLGKKKEKTGQGEPLRHDSPLINCLPH